MAEIVQAAETIPSPAVAGRPREAGARLDSVDLLRGIVMVLMALDHTRGFFSNATFYPLDLTQTNVPLYATRWITHFCAPVFLFLAGTGAYLSLSRGKNKPELSWYLLTRGLWLVLLELTVIRWFGWAFSVDFNYFGAAVIWAIGWSMVILAGLAFLPTPWVGLIGLAIVAGHNLLDPISPERFGSFKVLWMILHSPGQMELFNGSHFGVGYPLLPWLGVMLTGYGLGPVLFWDRSKRARILVATGLGMIALFFVLRATNSYGNPTAWSPQKNGLFTFLAMLDVQKYPPSLFYVLITLGPALIALALLELFNPAWMKPILVFGRVPLFYYLLHLPVIHGLAVLWAFARYGRADWLYGTQTGPRPEGWGFDLPMVYAVWILVIILLYPACRWFAELKSRRRDLRWLTYF